jgi:hypothetical protein
MQIMKATLYPLVTFIFWFAVLWLSVLLGDLLRKRVRPLPEEGREDFGLVVTATLTLLGLLIAFSFSMAVTRYDQRKNYEEAEANAIGTEYLRADFLPAADATKVRELLRKYTEQRVSFYTTLDQHEIQKINTDTARLQNDLWAAVRQPAAAQPNAVVALVVEGMNDVLNSQGYTQAAWWNPIPTAAWVLMVTIAMSCNILVGYGAHRTDRSIFLILPIAMSISFLLISDIDNPGGTIRVAPLNLQALAQSFSVH